MGLGRAAMGQDQRRAFDHLERQLHPDPRRASPAVDGSPPTRCGDAAGDQMRRPRHALRGPRHRELRVGPFRCRSLQRGGHRFAGRARRRHAGLRRPQPPPVRRGTTALRHLRRCPTPQRLRAKRSRAGRPALSLQVGLAGASSFGDRHHHPNGCGGRPERGASRHRHLRPGPVAATNPRQPTRTGRHQRPARSRIARCDPRAPCRPRDLHVVGVPARHVRLEPWSAHRPRPV